MHADDAVVDLAFATQPLPSGSDRMAAALGRARFVEATDGVFVSVVASDESLTFLSHAIFIPLDRFHESL